MTYVIFVLLSLSQPSQSPAPPPGGNQHVLQLAAHLYRGDTPAPSRLGNGTVAPLSHESAVSGFIWLSPTLCGIFSDADEPKGTEKADASHYNTGQHIPGSGWHATGRVLERSGDTFKVRVEWERRWDKSTRLTDGPKGARDITLRAGERIAFDGVGPTLPSECGMTGARLEATMVPRAAPVPAPSGALMPMSSASYETELSLVYKRPDGKEDVQRRNLRLGANASPFKFSAISVPVTDQDVIAINVQGSVRPMATAAGDVWLQFEIDRRINAPPGVVSGPTGTELKRIPLPSSSEPVSFDLPALSNTSSGHLAGHSLALRIRVVGKK
jgi:hypothetical protein